MCEAADSPLCPHLMLGPQIVGDGGLGEGRTVALGVEDCGPEVNSFQERKGLGSSTPESEVGEGEGS